MTEQTKCIKLLKDNGYKETARIDEYRVFAKMNKSSIRISSDKIRFANDDGEWLHLSLNYRLLLSELRHYYQTPISTKGLDARMNLIC